MAYTELCLRHDGDLPVAVGTPATAEDMPDASFAGQRDTYPGVAGGDAVMARMSHILWPQSPLPAQSSCASAQA